MTTMSWTIPNLLTLLRVSLIPVIVLLYCMPIDGVYAAAVFLLAGLMTWRNGIHREHERQKHPTENRTAVPAKLNSEPPRIESID